jgi:hypothetical protein
MCSLTLLHINNEYHYKMDLDRWDGTSDEVQQHGEPARVGPHPLLGSSELGKGNLPETLPFVIWHRETGKDEACPWRCSGYG